MRGEVPPAQRAGPLLLQPVAQTPLVEVVLAAGRAPHVVELGLVLRGVGVRGVLTLPADSALEIRVYLVGRDQV